MNEKQISKGSKLIAEYMVNDGKWVKPADGTIRDIERAALTQKEVKDMEYHSSWHWLMPVVEKVLSKVHSMSIQPDGRGAEVIFQSRDNNRCFPGIGNSDNSMIEAVYDAVIDFLYWKEREKIEHYARQFLFDEIREIGFPVTKDDIDRLDDAEMERYRAYEGIVVPGSGAEKEK